MMQDDPVEALYARAKQNGIPMSAICAKANVAETTPSRWRRDKNGATLTTLQKLHDALNDLLKSRPTKAAA